MNLLQLVETSSRLIKVRKHQLKHEKVNFRQKNLNKR